MSGKWAHRDVSDDEYEEEEEQQLPTPPPKSISPAPPAVTTPAVPAAPVNEPVHQDARARGSGSGLSGFVSGIKYSANEDDFGHFLASANCHVTNIRFQTDRESHRFNGKAVIQLADEESMQAFLSLDGTQYLGMSLRTKPNEQRQYGGDRDFTRGGGRGGGRGRSGDQGRGDYREQRDSGRGPQRDRRGGRGGDRAPREEVEEEEGPKERPKINLLPRSVPVNPENRPDRTSAIFGGGRPHDEQEYEERKKTLATTTPEAEATSTAEVAAPAPAAAPAEVSETPVAAVEGQTEEFTTVQRKGRGGAGAAKRVASKDSAPNKDKDAAGSGRYFQKAIGSIQRGSVPHEKEGGNKGPGDKKERTKDKKPRREKAKAENVEEDVKAVTQAVDDLDPSFTVIASKKSRAAQKGGAVKATSPVAPTPAAAAPSVPVKPGAAGKTSFAGLNEEDSD
eukprot:gene10286-11383_t